MDGCRVGTETWTRKGGDGSTPYGSETTWNTSKTPDIDRTASGRWPANLIHDGSEEVVGLFPGDEDGGSAARFFYCAKASKADRDVGCEGMELVTHQSGMGGSMPVDDDGNARDRFKAQSRNTHPTVKPTELMRYLCRLVTRPGGVVLDPFTGSGSTGRGAILEGFRFVGIEREPEYVAIARARIEDAVGTRRAETAQGELGL